MKRSRPRKVSTSSISAFMACPERYRLAYVEGIRPIEKTAALRVGSSWHAVLEAIGDAPDRQTGLTRALKHLEERYRVIPDGVLPETWAIERETLAVYAVAYLWHYADDHIESIATELPYDLPIHNPETGEPVPDDIRVGVIDNLIRRPNGCVCVREYKSTSRDIAPASDYWQRLKFDKQISMYLLSAQQMQQQGLLQPYGVSPSDPLICDVLYDVMKKPGIKPKFLSQADTTKLLDSAEYYGRKLIITDDTIDGWEFEVKPSGNKIAIKETPTMYGARLLDTICTEPAKHFARREIARTDAELRDFQTTLYRVYRTIVHMEENGYWYRNEQSCEVPYRCQYMPVCYYQQDTSNGQTPPGYERIFQVSVGQTA